jgi:Cu/Zn superoxide dismutase
MHMAVLSARRPPAFGDAGTLLHCSPACRPVAGSAGGHLDDQQRHGGPGGDDHPADRLKNPCSG